MSQPYVGEIKMFAGTFAPSGWALCEGQLLEISEHEDLFNLFGTRYGGDGQQTFALPDLRGRIPVHAGTGPGLSTRTLGEHGGVEHVTVTLDQLPVHSHTFNASTDPGNTASPSGAVLGTNNVIEMFSGDPVDSNLQTQSTSFEGGSQSHTNMMPYLCVNFIVALFGVYPTTG